MFLWGSGRSVKISVFMEFITDNERNNNIILIHSKDTTPCTLLMHSIHYNVCVSDVTPYRNYACI